MKKVCKENPRIQLIGERNRCDIQIQVRLSHKMDREEQMRHSDTGETVSQDG